MSNQSVLNWRYTNTLHGFNSLNEDGSLVVGLLFTSGIPADQEKEMEAKAEAALKALIPSKDFRFLSYACGRDYLQIPIESRAVAGKAIDLVRSFGYGVRLQTQLKAFYPSTMRQSSALLQGLLENRANLLDSKPRASNLVSIHYEPFSKETSEKLAVLQNPWDFESKEIHETMKTIWKKNSTLWFDERLWCTDEGKAYARKLQTICDIPQTTEALVVPQSSKDALCTFDFPV